MSICYPAVMIWLILILIAGLVALTAKAVALSAYEWVNGGRAERSGARQLANRRFPACSLPNAAARKMRSLLLVPARPAGQFGEIPSTY
jgi:hypothetical protein